MVGASSEAWGRSHHTDLGRAYTISKISLAGMTITAWRGCGRRLIFANKAGKGMTHGSPRRLLFHSIPFSSPYLFRSPHEPGNLQPQEGSFIDRGRNLAETDHAGNTSCETNLVIQIIDFKLGEDITGKQWFRHVGWHIGILVITAFPRF